MYRYLLFDLDGTLTDPAEGITKCVAYALAHFGIEAAPDTLKSFIGPPLLDQFMAYAGFDRDTASAAVDKYRERFREIGIFENRVLDGIPELLAELRDAGYVLCVSSSKPEVFVNRILEKYDLAQYFTVVVGSELDGTRGKKADVIEETLLRLGRLYPDEDFSDRASCLMIGDRIHDMEGAQTCRMDALGVTFGYAAPGELENSSAKGIASTTDEILAFVGCMK
ncbi:MAG: HAD family hydrolase [Ruminococcaceae bacterium]|nr:HAD family hydrolase [Oscillospiraceae bacterium]